MPSPPAGVGIKSLYHLYPNKEAIICQLAMDWLSAVCEAQEAIPHAGRQLANLLLLDEALEALDEAASSGTGRCGKTMDLIPALHQVEQGTRGARLRSGPSGCTASAVPGPEPRLTTLVRYFYRTADVAKQCTKGAGRRAARCGSFIGAGAGS